ncbi:MAG TPA: sulfotransferase [Thermoanaerobaculia bacterium]|nr:sulfotransferase [Thermoanaerobaculia bacterium]
MAVSRALPNLIVGGAQKSGTTTLHRLLESHPGVFFPARPQEIHFFDLDDRYARGLDWYAGHFTAWAGQPVIAQTSPLYLYEPAAAGRIAAALPAVRLIFVLRHPIERAASHYWHEVRYGWEPLSFEEALEREPLRLQGGQEARRHYSYLDRGRYAAQLRRYFDLFPAEQILVLTYDQLVADLPALGRRCAEFLGLAVEGWALPAREDSFRHNRAQRPRFRILQRWVRPVRSALPALAWLVDRMNLVPARYPPVAPETRARLAELFAPEIEDLARLTGLDLAAWREKP